MAVHQETGVRKARAPENDEYSEASGSQGDVDELGVFCG